MCDSTCDFTAEQAAERGVTILPFHYVEANKPDGGLSGDDDLFQSRSAHEFYDAIRHGAMPMTSQPSQLEYDEAFQAAYESGVPTVLFCISSGLSGGYNGAVMSLERLKEAHPDEEVRIYVVDTLVASTALTLLLNEACNKRDAGMNAERLVMWAEEARYFVDAEFMVDDLESLRRGGRIPSTVAYAGAKLDVKPLLNISIEGKLALTGVARGRKKGIRQLAEYCSKRMTDQMPGRCVVIGNADCPKDAARLKELLAKEDDNLLFLESSIGPVIGSHVGPGMLAVVFWGGDRREELSVADRIARKIKKEG